MPSPFDHTITSEEQLAALYRKPSTIAAGKACDHIDEQSQRFIAVSPFLVVSTTNRRHSRGDVSPKGGPPGFVKILDQKRLVIPDYNGNNRIDGIRNLLSDPSIGLLFLVPTNGESLRINGQGYPTTDPQILDMFTDEVRKPTSAIGVHVDEVMLHCAKALRRARLWQPDSWSGGAPTAGELLASHMSSLDMSPTDIDDTLEASYQADLAADAPEQAGAGGLS